ncbi:MAG: hypothetical protein LJE67_11695 [Salaquimonas sp.]|jgi:hypothetical protein|nr:hypothetical protein [Salaquimonas sp.]
MSNADLIAITEAIDALDKEDYQMGSAWNVAHELAQAHEGEAIFDRLHALLHRIERDYDNARYWYRRAGVGEFEGGLREEAKALLQELKGE